MDVPADMPRKTGCPFPTVISYTTVAKRLRYDKIIPMATKKEKVAVTIDHRVFGEAERLRRATGESRSALVNRALNLLVASEAREKNIAEYVQGYRNHPEIEDELSSAANVAAENLKDVPW